MTLLDATASTESTAESSGPGAGLAMVDLGACACFFGSGFLSLAYEICWIRKAALTFGATTFALSTVLAVFFAGLALGSYWFGKRSHRTARPLRLYGVLEIGVGLCALASPWAFSMADSIFERMYPTAYQDFALLSLIRFGLVAAILLPPTLLMGGTLPLFCRQYVASRQRITRTVALLYGLNVIGAAAGAAACGFWLIPQLGINTTLYVGGALNLLVGLLAWQLQRPLPDLKAEDLPAANANASTPKPAAPAMTDDEHPKARQLVAMLFFFTGFVALANEIVFTRYLALLIQNTVYTYTLTLTVILAGIVLGSLITAGALEKSRRRAFVFGGAQCLNGLAVLFVLMLPTSVWSGWLSTRDVATQLLIVLAVMLLPAVLSGISFPLAVRMAIDRPELVGQGVGRMTALNTMGGIAGSLAFGFFVMPTFGLKYSLLVTTGISVTIGLTAWLLLDRSWSPFVRMVCAGVIVAAWIKLGFFQDTRLPEDFLAGRDELIEFREGLSSDMAVVRRGKTVQLEIDRMWQGEQGRTHQVVAAHVPMILQPGAKRVAVVGLGPGQTASRFLMYPIDQLDCIEIERELPLLVKKHFDSAWMDDPRVRFIIDDGRNYLSCTDARYDLISIEIGQVFRPGMAAFYSLDFYRRAAERLNAGGLFCQFVPMDFFPPDDYRMVIRTFLEVFPNSALWYNRQELLLMGTRDRPLQITPEQLAILSTNEAVKRDLDFAYWSGPVYRLNRRPAFLSGYLCGQRGLRKLTEGAPVYRDDHPHLEYSTSLHRPSIRAKVTLVEAIRNTFDPVSTIYAGTLDPKVDELATAMRINNTGDLVATGLQEVQQGVADLNDPAKHELALDLLSRSVQWNPDNARGNMMLGLVHAMQGRHEPAIKYLRQAIAVDPNHAEAHYNLGSALLETSQLDEAVTHFRRSLELDPNFADAHFKLGDVLRQQGELDDAIKHLRGAIRLSGERAQFHHRLALALAAQGNWTEAQRECEDAVRRSPQNSSYQKSLEAIQARRLPAS